MLLWLKRTVAGSIVFAAGQGFADIPSFFPFVRAQTASPAPACNFSLPVELALASVTRVVVEVPAERQKLIRIEGCQTAEEKKRINSLPVPGYHAAFPYGH